MKKFLFFLTLIFVVLGAIVLSILLENEKTENLSADKTAALVQKISPTED